MKELLEAIGGTLLVVLISFSIVIAGVFYVVIALSMLYEFGKIGILLFGSISLIILVMMLKGTLKEKGE